MNFDVLPNYIIMVLQSILSRVDGLVATCCKSNPIFKSYVKCTGCLFDHFPVFN